MQTMTSTVTKATDASESHYRLAGTSSRPCRRLRVAPMVRIRRFG